MNLSGHVMYAVVQIFPQVDVVAVYTDSSEAFKRCDLKTELYGPDSVYPRLRSDAKFSVIPTVID